MKAEIQDVPAQPTLVQRFEVAPDQIGAKLGEVLPAVFNQAIGAKLSPGQPFVRYHGTGATMDMEAGVPVDRACEADGEIHASSLPACAAAVTVHQGPYTTLHETHAALATWAAEQRRKPAGGAWEVYITDPTDEPDETQWLTRIYLPLEP